LGEGRGKSSGRARTRGWGRGGRGGKGWGGLDWGGFGAVGNNEVVAGAGGGAGGVDGCGMQATIFSLKSPQYSDLT
jgi:hypothetical protein